MMRKAVSAACFPHLPVTHVRHAMRAMMRDEMAESAYLSTKELPFPVSPAVSLCAS